MNVMELINEFIICYLPKNKNLIDKYNGFNCKNSMFMIK